MKATAFDEKFEGDGGAVGGDAPGAWSAAAAAHDHDDRASAVAADDDTAPSLDEVREAAPAPDGEEKKTEVHAAAAAAAIAAAHSTAVPPPPPSPARGGSTIPDLSDPKSSPFRRSLDEEARAKDRRRAIEAERVAESKQLLRESLKSLSSAVDPHGESALTRPERAFLEGLLRSNGPGAAEACMAAHRRLMDGNLFWTICGGAAGEVGGLAPGHGWTTAAAAQGDGSHGSSLHSSGQSQRPDGGCGDNWVQEWMARGSQSGSNRGSHESDHEARRREGEGPDSSLGKEEGLKPITFVPSLAAPKAEASSSDRADSTGEITRPYDLQRRSSEARLCRLEARRRQASIGKDGSSRLFRAHEAGLVVTPGGSARRSLMRMGLPMERGLFGAVPPAPPRTPLGAGGVTEDEDEVDGRIAGGDPKVAIHKGSPNVADDNNHIAVEPTTFERALAKMDERTIRRIEREERAEQKKNEGPSPSDLSVTAPGTEVFNTGGCISPFSMSLLRRMFASKQFSFHRASSSYSRFDSFLNASHTASEPCAILSDHNDAAEKRHDIFRPSPKSITPEDRLKNLLVNAGFRDEADIGLVKDAGSEDDADVLSAGGSARALTKGGPSYRDVNVFRGEDPNKIRKMPNVASIGEKTKACEKQSSGRVAIQSSKLETSSLTIDTKLTSRFASPLGSIPPPPDIEEKSSDEAGDLPTLLPARLERLSQSERSPRMKHKRSSTVSIMKSPVPSSGRDSPGQRDKYKRSVSWGHMVFSKEEVRRAALSRQDSMTSSKTGLSIISFPNLNRAVPIRSDSISSNTSTMISFPPPLRLGLPLRSDSIGSLASVLSPVPSLSRAHPVISPRSSISMAPPLISRAHSIRSESQMTADTSGFDVDEDDSLNSEDYVDARLTLPSGAAWESPLMSRKRPPRHDRNTSAASVLTASNSVGMREHPVFLRQASVGNYEGMGIEIEEPELLKISLDDARRYKSMASLDGSLHSSRSFGRSQRSHRSSYSSRANNLPIKALDDGFIIQNIDFERHSSEILRSLSNEDLYSSHHIQTIRRDVPKGSKAEGTVSVAREHGLSTAATDSWDLESSASYLHPANAWGVLDDECAEGYGLQNPLPFQILGTTAKDEDCHPHVLSPPLMESLQNFFPPTISENNFWLKYSLVRDGASLPSLLRHIRGTRHTLIAIETVEGEVFGSFTSSPWRKNWNYYGSGESFLWRMRRTRSEKDVQRSVLDQAKLESELDVFYWTGRNDLVQYCTHDMIAVGGGALQDEIRDDEATDTLREGVMPKMAGFRKADAGGFGLAIDDELLRGTSSPCATFQSPPLSRVHADSPFEILNIEAWTTTPCATVAEAENMEMKTLFLSSHDRES